MRAKTAALLARLAAPTAALPAAPTAAPNPGVHLDVEITHFAHCGGPACGEWTEPAGTVPVAGATDYDLAVALAAATTLDARTVACALVVEARWTRAAARWAQPREPWYGLKRWGERAWFASQEWLALLANGDEEDRAFLRDARALVAEATAPAS